MTKREKQVPMIYLHNAERVAYTVTAEILVQADSAVLAERIVRDLICDVADDWRLVVERGNLLDQED